MIKDTGSSALKAASFGSWLLLSGCGTRPLALCSRLLGGKDPFITLSLVTMTCLITNLGSLSIQSTHDSHTSKSLQVVSEILIEQGQWKGSSVSADRHVWSAPGLIRADSIETEDSLLMIITIFSSTICGLYSVAKYPEVISH